MGPIKESPRNKDEKRNWIWILIILALGACEKKSELSIKDASNQFCNCFNSQPAGTVDDRLSPCLQEIADQKNDEWNKAGINNPDSINQKMSRFGLDVMLDMMRTCDNYFIAINDLYDKGYPADTTQLNWKIIKELSRRINTETNPDTVKSLLHKKAHRLIQAREFDQAFKSIDSIKTLDNRDYGANLASAYIFNQKGLYDKAVTEINKAIEISGDENLKLYAEIAKQKNRISKK
ncbi:hypothetical protein [Adhaeribacter terreus]|uniref:Tetratricopeptide repeat protein n=1 Tax=Adhaeribacter terreus TaxID=529703 RepID=A0ABW0EBQ7_9BACT